MLDYGASPNDSEDDAPAIRAALAEKKEVRIPQGRYLLASFPTTVFQDGHFVFHLEDGHKIIAEPGAEFYLADGIVNQGTAARGVNVFLSNSRSNISIKNLSINCNGNNNLVPQGKVRTCFGFLFHNSKNVSLDSVSVIDSPGRNAIVFGGAGGGNNCAAINCTIKNGGTSLASNIYQDDFSAIYCDSPNSSLIGNRILHDLTPFTYSGGIETHESNIRVEFNQIEKSHPAIYVANDYADRDIADVTISRNIIKDSLTGITITGNRDFERLNIKNNLISLSKFRTGALKNLAQIGISQPRDDQGNFSYSLILKDSAFDSNVFLDQELNAPLDWCNFLRISAADGLSVANNVFYHASGVPILLRGSPSQIKNIDINNNVFYEFGSNLGRYGKYVTFFDLSPPAGKNLIYDAQNVSVHHNTVIAPEADRTSLVAYYFNWPASSSVSGLDYRENKITNVGTIKSGPKALLVTTSDVSNQSLPLSSISYVYAPNTNFVIVDSPNTNQLPVNLPSAPEFGSIYSALAANTAGSDIMLHTETYPIESRSLPQFAGRKLIVLRFNGTGWETLY